MLVSILSFLSYRFFLFLFTVETCPNPSVSFLLYVSNAVRGISHGNDLSLGSLIFCERVSYFLWFVQWSSFLIRVASSTLRGNYTATIIFIWSRRLRLCLLGVG